MGWLTTTTCRGTRWSGDVLSGGGPLLGCPLPLGGHPCPLRFRQEAPSSTQIPFTIPNESTSRAQLANASTELTPDERA
jgi:hypothetical protein